MAASSPAPRPRLDGRRSRGFSAPLSPPRCGEGMSRARGSSPGDYRSVLLLLWSPIRLPRAVVFSTASTGLLTPVLRSLSKLDVCQTSAQGIPAPGAWLQQDRRNVRSPAFSLQRGALNRARSGHHHSPRTQRAGRPLWRSKPSMGEEREGEDKHSSHPRQKPGPRAGCESAW